MLQKSESYPALHVIFTLLNAIRRGIERKNIWREFRRQKIALRPRLSFWIALCKEAKLIDDYEDCLRVTRQARIWLNKTSEEQTFHLIDSWQNAPKNHKARQFRKKLLWKLKHDKPLTQKDLLAMNGLEALGVCEGAKLTTWGKFFLKGEGVIPTIKSSVPCQIHRQVTPRGSNVGEAHFIAFIPQHIDLLWELEKYLRPLRPGVYPLTGRSHSFHQGDPHELISLLEHGLQAPLPGDMKARLLQQPSLRLIEGIVVEFSHPAELARLRRQPNVRRHIEHVLSPRHIVISTKDSKTLLPMLSRRGISLAYHEEPPVVPRKRTHFRQKKQVVQPVGRSVPKLELLTKYLQLQQAVDVLYRTPGYPAEHRRITPLMIEQRGEHTCVIAYCQTRRARRVFRLDRMEIPGTY